MGLCAETPIRVPTESEVTMGSVNCWEFKKCERQPGGAKVDELGVCPAATMAAANGYCGGKNGGRACAYIAGTFCGGTVQGDSSAKEKHCAECAFYQALKKEHGARLSALSFRNHVNEAA